VRGWLLTLAALMLPSMLGAQTISALIISPSSDQPIFGQVDVMAEIHPPEDAVRVEFYVDGEKVGELTQPPFRLAVDVGQENREHRFEVRAYDRSGQMAESVLVAPPIQIDERLEAELQQLYVTVTDGESRVLDLTEEEFSIVDNGRQQDLVTFARGDVRLTAAILVDASASMAGRRLSFALDGAASFVTAMQSSDDASILLFSDRLLHATPFSNDPGMLTSGLAEVHAAGGTALNDHLYLALKLLEHEQGRRVVILLSDGIDSHSALRMEEVIWLAQRSRALIYWILTSPADPERYSAWKNPQRYRDEHDQLKRCVLQSGGRIVTLENIEDAQGAFDEILRELREQYVLGYYPNDSRNDGSWHQVHVRLTRSGGLRVRTRGGYIDY
jgi:Ca-activated chloride channel family protein